jgi:hypothetical protein
MFSGVDHSLRAKLIEQYLLGVEGVMDASTWFDNNELRAQVTIIPQWLGYELDEQALIESCKTALGADNAPSQILVLTARPRAVVRVA